MDGEGENGIIIAKYVSSAVAVVDVGVDDDGPFDEAVGLQTANGDGDIVDRAETFAVAGVGVVKAATEIAAEAITKSQLASKDGSTGCEPNGFGEFRRIRDFEFHDFAGGEG